MTHRGLTSYDAKGDLRGELAESWERDGNAWVFHLREAIFHNGAPVTADDVKWTLEQVAAEKSIAYMRGQFAGVDRIETPDRAHRAHRDETADRDAADLAGRLRRCRSWPRTRWRSPGRRSAAGRS